MLNIYQHTTALVTSTEGFLDIEVGRNEAGRLLTNFTLTIELVVAAYWAQSNSFVLTDNIHYFRDHISPKNLSVHQHLQKNPFLKMCLLAEVH